ncbi:hypothetical protein TNCV_3471431 [Trichonephila clavipes]|nr:hypothetical protein TNCV_3471431 [Trichonephila clavipes]
MLPKHIQAKFFFKATNRWKSLGARLEVADGVGALNLELQYGFSLPSPSAVSHCHPTTEHQILETKATFSESLLSILIMMSQYCIGTMTPWFQPPKYPLKTKRTIVAVQRNLPKPSLTNAKYTTEQYDDYEAQVFTVMQVQDTPRLSKPSGVCTPQFEKLLLRHVIGICSPITETALDTIFNLFSKKYSTEQSTLSEGIEISTDLITIHASRKIISKRRTSTQRFALPEGIEVSESPTIEFNDINQKTLQKPERSANRKYNSKNSLFFVKPAKTDIIIRRKTKMWPEKHNIKVDNLDWTEKGKNAQVPSSSKYRSSKITHVLQRNSEFDHKNEREIITHEFQNLFKNDNKERFKIQFQVRSPNGKSFSVIKRWDYIKPPSDKYYPHSHFQHTQVKRLNDDNEIQNDIEESERAKVRAEQEILKELTKARLTSEAKLLERILRSRNNTYKKHDSNGLNKRKTRDRMFKHKKFTPFKNKAFARKKLLVGDSPFGSIDQKKARTGHFYEKPVSQKEKNHVRNSKQSFPNKLQSER